MDSVAEYLIRFLVIAATVIFAVDLVFVISVKVKELLHDHRRSRRHSHAYGPA
jgi:hypothetical protein